MVNYKKGDWITILGREDYQRSDVVPGTYQVDNVEIGADSRIFPYGGIDLADWAPTYEWGDTCFVTHEELEFTRHATDKEILIANIKQ